jgi:hypothetical protein
MSDDILVLRVHYSAQMLWSAFPELLLTWNPEEGNLKFETKLQSFR